MFIVCAVVLVAAIGATAGQRPPWSFQPATTPLKIRRKTATRDPGLRPLFAVSQDDQRTNPLLESLRAAGILRRSDGGQPVVGTRAYVRWWERLRAAIVLAAIIAGLGIALAAVIGVTVIAVGFLLEQAIS